MGQQGRQEFIQIQHDSTTCLYEVKYRVQNGWKCILQPARQITLTLPNALQKSCVLLLQEFLPWTQNATRPEKAIEVEDHLLAKFVEHCHPIDRVSLR